MSKPDYSIAEQMIVSAARVIKDNSIIYSGVGLPTVAVLLAKLTHAPNCTIIFETGILRTEPCLLTLGVDTLPTHTMANMIADIPYINFLSQRGYSNIGFVGCGQIDRYGNINSTAIGDYRNPTLRFPGSGGGCDIISLCRNVVVVLQQKKHRFPEKVDFCTGPGFLDGKPGSREKLGMLPGTGPTMVITNLAAYRFEEREMVVASYHGDAGVTLEQVKSEIGWDIKVAGDVHVTEPPEKHELTCLRETIDPSNSFVGGRSVL